MVVSGEVCLAVGDSAGSLGSIRHHIVNQNALAQVFLHLFINPQYHWIRAPLFMASFNLNYLSKVLLYQCLDWI